MYDSLNDFWRKFETLGRAEMVAAIQGEIRRLDAKGARLPRSLHRYRRQLVGLDDVLRNEKPTYLAFDELLELKPFAGHGVAKGMKLDLSRLFS